VTGIEYSYAVISGVPVVATPAEIDVTTAAELRAALLHAAGHVSPVIVVDMTGTLFCDSAGLHALIAAQKRALAENAGLRLVIPADGVVPRVFTLTGLDRFIPCYASVADALAETAVGASPEPLPSGPSAAREPHLIPEGPAAGH
jgi:anti-sigma B factor antagonist